VEAALCKETISGTIEIVQTGVDLSGNLLFIAGKLSLCNKTHLGKANPLKVKVESLECGTFCACVEGKIYIGR
jgi:hypothetical protein